MSVGHDLLAGVAAVHHEGVAETLNDWAAALLEAAGSPFDGGVSDALVVVDGDVAAQRWVLADDVVNSPFVEKFDRDILSNYFIHRILPLSII